MRECFRVGVATNDGVRAILPSLDVTAAVAYHARLQHIQQTYPAVWFKVSLHCTASSQECINKSY